jgi:hypothetical protein
MNEQWYCPNCSELRPSNSIDSGDKPDCQECGLDLCYLPPFVLAMQEHISEKDAELVKLREQVRLAEKAITNCNGCIEAARIEGLSEVLAETADERLKDLVLRRLLWVEVFCTEYIDSIPRPQEQGDEY